MRWHALDGLKGLFFIHKTMGNDIRAFKEKMLDERLTPLERCWAIRNYVGTITSRYDLADDIGATICDLMITGDKAEYWAKVKDYILGGR